MINDDVPTNIINSENFNLNGTARNVVKTDNDSNEISLSVDITACVEIFPA